MTYAELTERMSNQEFELWLAYEMLKSEQCPNCGLEARDLMEFELVPVRCPHCKNEYKRIRRFDQWRSSVQATRSAG